VTLTGRQAALDLALNLARMPTLAPAMRAQPIPPDTLVVIRLAAGCAATTREAIKATGLPVNTLRDASVFYLQEILLASEATATVFWAFFPVPHGEKCVSICDGFCSGCTRTETQMTGRAFLPSA
jgi:hypothetical protein